MTKIYVAGPLFNTHERWYLEQIAAALESAGYSTFLPHRDAGDLGEPTYEARKRVFYADLTALDECDACVALLTGADHDSGTCVELGYMFANKKPCFGISDDRRWLNNMVWGVCKDGEHVVTSIDMLIPLVQAELKG
ncbi:MAG: nucleoside 2-deoxyribosyltransferase [Chloroflexi bacterium]|nr:nucleoside 2-deoxyribosyltransferase [Chloroflexota bacterium]MCC6896296.1 nucleoside 2-deoxyribosyltransferase [Anaerolineae bacterium]